MCFFFFGSFPPPYTFFDTANKKGYWGVGFFCLDIFFFGTHVHNDFYRKNACFQIVTCRTKETIVSRISFCLLWDFFFKFKILFFFRRRKINLCCFLRGGNLNSLSQ
jgi:hypothetical protein